jgi:hypothetical protein
MIIDFPNGQPRARACRRKGVVQDATPGILPTAGEPPVYAKVRELQRVRLTLLPFVASVIDYMLAKAYESDRKGGA